MEKFFLKVLHEEPVAELSLHELVGGYGGINVCSKNEEECPCNDGSYITCPDLCTIDFCLRDCDLRVKCPPATTIGGGGIQ